MFTKTIMYSSAAFPNVNMAAQLTGDPTVQSQLSGRLGQILQAAKVHFCLSFGRDEQNRSCNLTPGLKITLTGKFLLQINFLISSDKHHGSY